MTVDMIEELKKVFVSVVNRYCGDDVAVERAWKLVVQHYTEKGRHYHSLGHLSDIIEQLQPFKDREGWDAMVLATFYHDIIYSVVKQDNEERSADMAAAELSLLRVPETVINDCVACIVATKSHEPTGNIVVDLFTDADMSILGRDWDTYIIYAQNVRKEYSIYPDLLYKPGRKKVLAGFLAMERIFKTPHFFDRYEVKARENVRREMRDV